MNPTHEAGGRLLVLGGGLASLTATFYASEPGHEQVFPGGIHVFEMSDRLGGKGASGRTTTSALRDRIEEHGLHVWFGFYDNAFATLEKCHAYLEQEARRGYVRWASSLRSIESGFRACHRVGLMDHDGSDWSPWVADFPEDSTSRPWHPRRAGAGTSTAGELTRRALRMVEAFLYSLSDRALVKPDGYASFLDVKLGLPVELPRMPWSSQALDAWLDGALSHGANQEALSRALAGLSRLLSELRARSGELLHQHEALRRGWYMADMLLAAVRGVIDDGVLLTNDYSLLDDFELREWLMRHGASHESVSSAFLKAIVYGLAFAYEDGDPDRPACSAATGVYGLMRVLLTYRGAMMWKMNAGMGEIVFAPLYEALLRRGVRFHFGHRLQSLRVEQVAGRYRARELGFEIRNRLSEPRLPALDIEEGSLAGRLPYWPDCALGPAREAVLELGAHDLVVYGLPVGTIAEVVHGAPPRWQKCCESVKTVPTLALQLWLNRDVQEYAPWAAPDITVGAYTQPFDTWSDMRVLAGEAANDPRQPVKSVAYFANVAPTHLSQLGLEDTVDHFMRRGLSNLWPRYAPDMELDRYARLNNDTSSRYTLSVPGSLKARLHPLDDSIANVRPTGDWTRNSISAGCIEATVISGMLASLALRPDLDLRIIGEDMMPPTETP